MSINSKSFNQLILVGRLGRDAEVAQTKNGYPYVKLALATADLVKNASGNYEDTRSGIRSSISVNALRK